MLKKFSLITIIAILAYSQVGYYFVIRHLQSVQKEAIKEKILSQLKDEELEIISLNDNHKRIYWEEEGKEFLFEGEMYDVVKRKIINNEVVLYCIHDKKEKILIDNYNLITKQNSSSEKKGKNNIDNPTNLFVYQNEKNIDLYFTRRLNNFCSYDFRLPENLINNLSPPPKA